MGSFSCRWARTRFLNLWAALECLASLVDEATISRRVTELVCPIVTWRKVEKLGRYIAINLHLWRKSSGQLASVTAALPNATEHGVPTSEVITALLCDNLHYYVSSLLSRVIHGVSKNEGWQPEEAVKHWQLTGNFVLNGLKNQPEVLTLDNLMPITTAEVSVVSPWAHLKHVSAG